jgi:hypothetical protein
MCFCSANPCSMLWEHGNLYGAMSHWWRLPQFARVVQEALANLDSMGPLAKHIVLCVDQLGAGTHLHHTMWSTDADALSKSALLIAPDVQTSKVNSTGARVAVNGAVRVTAPLPISFLNAIQGEHCILPPRSSLLMLRDVRSRIVTRAFQCLCLSCFSLHQCD